MTYREAMHQAELRYWRSMLDEHSWNYAHTAQAAGVNRPHLYEILRRLGISRDEQARAA